MRLVVSFSKAPATAAPAHWQIELEGKTRLLGRSASGFPFALDDAERTKLPERYRLPDGALDDGRVRVAFLNIQAGMPRAADPQEVPPSAGDMVEFGRYLLETLLGPWWAPTAAACPKDETLELLLRIPAAEWELNRLPWEMLAVDNEFLAAGLTPEVVLTREVKVEGQAPASPPELTTRVLFVVGSDLTDSHIRAGTEHLGLLRRLRGANMALDHRILLAATANKLADAALKYRPTVIHFTGHGEWDAIRLRAEEGAPPLEQKSGSRLTADQLITLFKSRGVPLPSIFVVNACDTATGRSPTASGAAPPVGFAVELSRQGIPLVIGMAGKVADHACRLFTRRFYEALLVAKDDTPVDVAQAAAEGRRAALTLGGAHEASDWAFPRVFVRSDASTMFRVTGASATALRERIARRHRIAAPFCDRLEFFADFGQWIDSGEWKQNLFILQGPPVEPQRVRWGLTWLMKELAAQAAYAGFLPLFVSFDADSKEARPPLAIVKDIRDRISNEVRQLNKELLALAGTAGPQPTLIPRHAGSQHQSSLLLRSENPAHPLHPEITLALGNGALTDYAVIRTALAMDLHELSTALQPHGLRPMLFLDGLHACILGVGRIVEVLEAGLDHNGVPTPAVVSCRLWPTESASYQAIKHLIEMQFTHRKELKGFAKHAEEALAYQQYVILRSPPHAPDPQRKEAAESVHELLSEAIQGTPEKFDETQNDELRITVKTLIKAKILRLADDDQILKELIQRRPPRGGG